MFVSGNLIFVGKALRSLNVEWNTKVIFTWVGSTKAESAFIRALRHISFWQSVTKKKKVLQHCQLKAKERKTKSTYILMQNFKQKNSSVYENASLCWPRNWRTKLWLEIMKARWQRGSCRIILSVSNRDKWLTVSNDNRQAVEIDNWHNLTACPQWQLVNNDSW